MTLIGTTLGEYRVEAIIGRGSIGQVVRAVHSLMPVAIKLIDPHLIGNPEFKWRFIEHAQRVTTLNHPNIARVYHVGEQDGLSYVVTELVTGGSLEGMRPGPATREWSRAQWAAVELVKQAADGLAYAHSQKLLHGDVKLSNLLLKADPTGTTQVKITDVGLTALVRSLLPSARPAAGGDVLAVEQDVYALGGALYEVTTGRAALLRQGPAAEVNSAYAITPPSQILNGYPPALEAVVMRSLAADPAQRFPSAAALSSALATALQSSGARAVPAVRPPSGMTPKSNEQDPTAVVMLSGRKPPQPPDGPSPESVPCVCVLDAAGDRIAAKFLRGAGITIGRGPDNDIILSSDQVSSNHARIAWDGTRVLVTDLGSANSTFLQGQRLLPQVTQEWGPSQWLQVGPYWVWLQESRPIHTDGDVEVMLDQASRAMTLTPGKPANCNFKLVNQKTKVDRVTVAVDGIPGEWLDGAQREIRLQPFETREVSLAINVPKTAEARAKVYTVTIRPESAIEPDKEQRTATAQWTVLPFDAGSISINPGKGTGRRRAKYAVTIRNEGNRPSTYTLSASDDESVLDCVFSSERQSEQARLPIELEPGSKMNLRLQVKAPRLWVGKASPYAFTVVAQAREQGSSPTIDGQFTHVPVFATWMLAVAPLVLIALVWWGLQLSRPIVRTVYVEPREPVVGQPVEVFWDAAKTSRLRLLVNELPVRPDPDPEQLKYVFSNGFQKDTRVRVVGSSLFGEDSKEVTVTVLAPPAADLPLVELTVDPPTVTVGQSATVTWKVLRGTRATLDPIGTVALEGSRVITPTATQEYTLTGFNRDDKDTRITKTVEVVKAQPVAALVSLTASTSRVTVGQNVTFEWRAANASSVRIESFTPTMLQGAGGRRQARLRGEGTYEFTLVATNEKGEEVKSRTVIVEAKCSNIAGIIRRCRKQPQLEWVGGN